MEHNETKAPQKMQRSQKMKRVLSRRDKITKMIQILFTKNVEADQNKLKFHAPKAANSDEKNRLVDL